MRKYIILSLLCCLWLNTKSQATAADCDYIIASQTAYLLKLQLSDGAICMSLESGTDGFTINPYFSNMAASALLENAVDVPAVIKYMDWYLKNINTNGTIYDHIAQLTVPPTYMPYDHYDSIDSYAATFISLCRKLCEKSSDLGYSWVKANKDKITLISTALRSTIDAADGLTWNLGTPGKQKYTMDNAEANKGMADMDWLWKKVLTIQSNLWYNYWVRNTAAIKRLLWDSRNARYRVGIGFEPNLSILNPDALCQFYPLVFKVPQTVDVSALTATFNKNFADWPLATVKDSSGFPCTIMSVAMALIKGQSVLGAYLLNLKKQIVDNALPANWYNMEAAEVVIATTLYKDKLHKRHKVKP